MSQRANYFKLGLFVVGAIVAGIIVLVIIGTGRILQTRVTIETYFNESVQGLDIEGVVANLNKLLTTTNDRVAALDTKSLQQRTERTLAKIESTLNDVAAKKLSDEALALLADLRKTNTELQATLSNPSFKKLPESADAALQKVRDLASDPRLASSIAHMESTLSRLDRIFGGGEGDLSTTI